MWISKPEGAGGVGFNWRAGLELQGFVLQVKPL